MKDIIKLIYKQSLDQKRARPATNGMKIKASIKKICDNCKIVRRNRHLRVICTNPKHKQKQ